MALPNALSKKLQYAGRDPMWQYVFPGARLTEDPRTLGVLRHNHVWPQTSASREASGEGRGFAQAGHNARVEQAEIRSAEFVGFGRLT